MVISKMFWFRCGLNKFIEDVNCMLEKCEGEPDYQLVALDFYRGTFGIRWLAVAVLEKVKVSMDPLPSCFQE